MRFLTLLITSVLGLCVTAPAPALAKVEIFACGPEWASLAAEIGQDQVRIHTASHAHQDIHFMRAKPSLLAAMRRADLVFCSGADLEVGWLPILMNKAAGPHLQPGSEGWLMASDHVDLIGAMEHADRSMGHVHPKGNPHVHLHPDNILPISKELTNRLSILDPDHEKIYRDNFQIFAQNWQAFIKQLHGQIKNLRGQKIVVQHNAWLYMVDWLGLEIIATMEPLPGLPPTASHLERVYKDIKNQKVLGILITPYESDEAARWVSEKTGIPVLRLPFTVGGSKKATDIISLYKEHADLLRKALNN